MDNRLVSQIENCILNFVSSDNIHTIFSACVRSDDKKFSKPRSSLNKVGQSVKYKQVGLMHGFFKRILKVDHWLIAKVRLPSFLAGN